MKRALWLCAVVPLLGADADDTKKELARFAGTWSLSELNWNGKDLTGNPKTAFRFVFKGDEAVVEGSEAVRKEYARIEFKIDPSTRPRIMDITVTGGTQKDAAIEGIYEFKDGQLRICARVFGKDRPGTFEAPAGSSIVLVVLKRETP
jgi:uncharacterized protein (TIGR03067 family)